MATISSNQLDRPSNLLREIRVYLGYRNRFQPPVHKRLMWFATLSLLDAGFDRWPTFDPYSLPVVNLICYTPLLLLLIGYDWWSAGKVQRVTIWSTIFMVVVQQIRHPRPHRCLAGLRGLVRDAYVLFLLKTPRLTCAEYLPAATTCRDGRC